MVQFPFDLGKHLIGVCSNASIVYRCSLVKCLYPILCRFSGYGSKVILSCFKALHFRVESSVGNPHSKSWWRYETAGSFIAGKGGVLTREEASECLSMVHWKDLVWENGTVEDTQFSNVYDQKALTLDLRNWNDYDTPVHFAL